MGGQLLVQLQHRLDQTDHLIIPRLDVPAKYRVPVLPRLLDACRQLAAAGVESEGQAREAQRPA
jgi:hypothetical protein